MKDCNVPEGSSVPPKNSGRLPVMASWFTIVLPALLLCYAAQVGYLLSEGVPPRASTFFAITHKFGVPWLDRAVLVLDMVIAGVAAFIASQAVITGLFSIFKQAIALGFMPRCRVQYTSVEGEGQVYLPFVNWSLFLGCVAVVLFFRNAGNLASAYGIAVTATMGITTIMFGAVAYYRWKWSLMKVVLILLPILVIDLAFLGSNLLKFTHGGYFPVLIALLLIVIMTTWQWGRRRLGTAFYEFGVREGKKINWLVALRDMLDDIELSIKENLPAARQLIQGKRRLVESDRAAVFLVSRDIQSVEDYVPVVLRVFLKKYGVLPSNVVLMHVHQESVAFVKKSDRFAVKKLGNDIHSVTVNYGYMEQPDIRKSLRELRQRGRLEISADRWIIEVGEEDILIAPSVPWWLRLRIGLFSWILRLSTPAHKYLGLGFDAAVSKEIIPVVFETRGARITLPELEVIHDGR
jgi:KUP system potassium uptake protein